MNSTSIHSTWRVVLNSKLWNQEKFEEDFLNEKVNRIPQSKGRCIMKKCPKKNDIVFFVIKKKIRMKGVVEIDGFIEGNNHQDDIYNTGEIRKHSEVEEFTWVNITEVGLNETIIHMGQRTWVKLQ
jgi:hypothetical protein